MGTSFQHDPTLQQRVVVGVGEFAASNNGHVVLSTFALGSCVGLIAHDSEQHAVGLLHCMLPDSTAAREKAQDRPAMYADTGFNLLMRNMMSLGARIHRIRFIIAGGAGNHGANDFFRIGARNLETVEHLLDRHQLRVQHRFVGGSINRTVHFSVGAGTLVLRTPLGTETFSCYG